MINVIVNLETIPEGGTVLDIQSYMPKIFSNQILENAKVKMDDILNNMTCSIHAEYDQTITLSFQGDILGNSGLHYEITDCCCDRFRDQLTTRISEEVQKIQNTLESDQ